MKEQASEPRPRRPWRAVLGNLVAFPLGHVYVGRPVRGMILYGVFAFAWVGALLLAVHAPGRALFIAAMGTLAGVFTLFVLDGYTVARRASTAYTMRPYNRWWVYLGVFVGMALVNDRLASVIRDDLVQAFKMPTASMLPTLEIGDHILADKAAYASADPQRFDLVVFEYSREPDKIFIKRVVGLPGETVEMRDGVVWIDGSPLDEPRVVTLSAGPTRALRTTPASEIPAGSYYVLGDNRDQSYDSRYWGPVRREKILGRVGVIYWSWASDGSIHWNRIGRRVE